MVFQVICLFVLSLVEKHSKNKLIIDSAYLLFMKEKTFFLKNKFMAKNLDRKTCIQAKTIIINLQ